MLDMGLLGKAFLFGLSIVIESSQRLHRRDFDFVLDSDIFRRTQHLPAPDLLPPFGEEEIAMPNPMPPFLLDAPVGDDHLLCSNPSRMFTLFDQAMYGLPLGETISLNRVYLYNMCRQYHKRTLQFMLDLVHADFAQPVTAIDRNQINSIITLGTPNIRLLVNDIIRTIPYILGHELPTQYQQISLLASHTKPICMLDRCSKIAFALTNDPDTQTFSRYWTNTRHRARS